MSIAGWAARAFALSACVFASDDVIGQTTATRHDTPVPVRCVFSKPASIVSAMRDLPELGAEFSRQKLAIADVGEPFVPFDIRDAASEGLPDRQFVRAYVFDDRVVVWYYRGGFATGINVVELRSQRGDDVGRPVLRLTGISLRGPLCAATQALLDGVSAGSW